MIDNFEDIKIGDIVALGMDVLVLSKNSWGEDGNRSFQGEGVKESPWPIVVTYSEYDLDERYYDNIRVGDFVSVSKLVKIEDIDDESLDQDLYGLMEDMCTGEFETPVVFEYHELVD